MAVKVVGNATPDGSTERVMTEINNPLGPSPHIEPIDHLVLPLSRAMFAVPVHQRRRSGQFPPKNNRATRIGSSPQRSPTDVQALRTFTKTGTSTAIFHPKFLLNPESDEVYLIDFETLTKTEGARQEAHWANSDYMAPKSTNPRASFFKPPILVVCPGVGGVACTPSLGEGCFG